MVFVVVAVVVGIVGGAWPARDAQAQGTPLQAAEEAYKQGQWARARDLAYRAITRDPIKAWRLSGAAACMMKDRFGALEAMTHLPSKEDREFIRFACSRNELEILEDDVAVFASPARKQVEAAQASYDQRKYAEAKKLALEASTIDPKLTKAWRLLGAASCWTQDKYTAQKASDHLQPVDQEALRGVCARTLGAKLRSNRTVR